MAKSPTDTGKFTNADLRRMYEEDRLSYRQVARNTGLSHSTVRYRLALAGAISRSASEAKRGHPLPASAIAASVHTRRKYVLEGRPEVGYKIDCYGYVLLWNKEKHGYEKEHRLVLAKKLSRPLLRGEDGHHINGIKTDNRPENLELMSSRSVHLREHMKTRVRDSLGRVI